jgi:hypothetical protein
MLLQPMLLNTQVTKSFRDMAPNMLVRAYYMPKGILTSFVCCADELHIKERLLNRNEVTILFVTAAISNFNANEKEDYLVILSDW